MEINEEINEVKPCLALLVGVLCYISGLGHGELSSEVSIHLSGRERKRDLLKPGSDFRLCNRGGGSVEQGTFLEYSFCQLPSGKNGPHARLTVFQA